MQLHDALRDRQAESGVGGAAMSVPGLVEAIEHAGEMLGSDARPAVGHRHPHRASFGGKRDADRPAVGRVRQRVVDQVLQHPFDEGDVRVDHRQRVRGFDVDGRTVALRLELKLLCDVAGELGERDRLAYRRLLVGIELRELEQIADEAAQPLALIERHRQVAFPLGRRELRVLELQRLDVSVQRGERGAQIVRDVRHHLPAQGVRLLQGVELLADAGRHFVVRTPELRDLVSVTAARGRGRERLEGSKPSGPEPIDVIGETAQSAGHRPKHHEPGERAHHDTHDERESAVARDEARVQQRRDGVDAFSQQHHVQVAFRILVARDRGDGERLVPVVAARIVAEHGIGIAARQERMHRSKRDPLALDDARIGREGQDDSVQIN